MNLHRSVGALIASIMALTWLAVPAAAAPDDPIPPQPLIRLGSSDVITFGSLQAAYSLTLPVPAGVAPAALTGLAQPPPGVTGGYIDVYQGERRLSRTPMPGNAGGPVRLPLTGARVENNAVDLTLNTFFTADGFCQFDTELPYRIIDARAEYAGAPAVPATLSDLLPPILDRLVIYLPADPSRTEGAAAVNLAAAVINRYGTAEVTVETRELSRDREFPDADMGPLDRYVIIREGDDTGLRLLDTPTGPMLQVGGSAEQLLTQTTLLTSSLDAIAAASSAIAGSLNPAPQLPRTAVDLADLGIPDLSVTAASRPSLSFGVDQTRLGGPARNVRIELRGSYTPLPGDSGGRLVARVGDSVVDTWSAAPAGTYSRWVNIPDRLLTRYTEVTLTLERGDDLGGCGDGQRTTLTLDSASPLQYVTADPPVPSGLASMPQSLMPRLDLAWSQGDLADVRRAVTLISGLQRLSATPLGIDVVDFSEALTGSHPAVLIDADGGSLGDLTLPVTAESDGQVRVARGDTVAELTVVPELRFGSLQAVRHDGVAMLVATSHQAPGELDALLGWFGSDAERWSRLAGEAMLQLPDSEPVVVVGDPVEAAAPSESGWSAAAVAGLVLGLAAILLAVGSVGYILLQRRRSGPSGS